VRTTALITLALACSTSSKREDVAPMPQPPAPGSGSTTAPLAGPKVYLSTPSGEVSVNVEVVATEAKIEKGLMYRQHLPTDAGMLFEMGFEKDWAFWMRNTLIPLDMIFIGKDMTIAGIVENAEPLTESLRQVGKPSLYVLEVNGGWTKASGVAAGAKVRFDKVP
jgi:uncharacterized membrane protein (UPF0127 family)